MGGVVQVVEQNVLPPRPMVLVAAEGKVGKVGEPRSSEIPACQYTRRCHSNGLITFQEWSETKLRPSKTHLMHHTTEGRYKTM
jgi:hypothetical protein